jgi:4-oxalocrotonate tautomerase
MPFISVKVLQGVFAPKQKRDMIRKITDAVLSIEGESARDRTWVVIEEVKSGQWGVGGKPVTTSQVKRHAARELRG